MQINQINKYSHSVAVGGSLAAGASITINAPVPHAHLILATLEANVGVIPYTSDNTLSSALLATKWSSLPTNVAVDVVCDYVYILNANSSSANYVILFEW